PLTTHPAHDFMPVWSHDGRQIAFASDRHGNFDIYVMPATGGEPRRLTFHSAPAYPYAFTPDDKDIIFRAARHDAPSNPPFPRPPLSPVSIRPLRRVAVTFTYRPPPPKTWRSARTDSS